MFISFDAEIGASKKKSHNQYDEWAIPIGIAHFKNKQKYYKTMKRGSGYGKRPV